MAAITARVQVDQTINGNPCKCGEIISADAAVLKPYIKDGVLDDSKAGIEYALSEGVKVRELSAPPEVVEEPPAE